MQLITANLHLYPMKYISIIILFFSCLVFPAAAQVNTGSAPDSVINFIATSLQIIRANAINRDSVNWEILNAEVIKRTSNATSYDSAATVFPYVFEYIDDHHGALKIGKRSYYWKKPFIYKNTEVRSAIKDFPVADALMLSNKIAYIRLPGNNDFSGAKINSEARQIRNKIDSLSAEHPAGWIVDLRLNTGGSMYQMLAGIAPLLRDGEVGSFINQHGKNDGKWILRNGNIYLDSNQVSKLEPLKTNKKLLPVAVLTSGMTASAGEVVAISFAGAANTIHIGENTAGYITANEGFKINEIAGLNLAVDYDADRDGKIYKDFVRPDILIQGGDNFKDLSSDTKVQTAVRWLKGNNKRGRRN
jgi:carboxyl-terminal processing protease